MYLKIVANGDDLITERRTEIVKLIENSRLKLGQREIEDYFRPGNDFVLAMENDDIVGLSITTKIDSGTEFFLGFLLAVVRPDYRQFGLLGKMASRYFLTRLPGILKQKLLRPALKCFVFADVSNPISYRRLHLNNKVIPDLVHGNVSANLEYYKGVRRRLGALAGNYALDPDTGFISDSSAVPPNEDLLSDSRIDEKWALKWANYVPRGSDLLVLMPIEMSQLLKCFTSILSLSRSGTLRGKHPMRRKLITRGTICITLCAFQLA